MNCKYTIFPFCVFLLHDFHCRQSSENNPIPLHAAKTLFPVQQRQLLGFGKATTVFEFVFSFGFAVKNDLFVQLSGMRKYGIFRPRSFWAESKRRSDSLLKNITSRNKVLFSGSCEEFGFCTKFGCSQKCILQIPILSHHNHNFTFHDIVFEML